MSLASVRCWFQIKANNNWSPDYRRAVLSILGHQLQGLSLCETTNIDVIAELEPCHQLEELEISYGCNLLPPPHVAVDFPSAGTFLPHLKTLKINCCIGPWSPLFERERPLLTKLELHCSHIGMTPRSKFNWIDVPNLWPNLREMTLYYGEGLTVDTLREIVPQLKHLERLTIPKFLVGCPNEQVRLVEFQKEMKNKQDPTDCVLLNIPSYTAYSANDHF